ncbi:hypothetical protein AAG570_012784 [Ranatra chinensis]|uniref:Uncharacterized protein n=1 Tax=Ranatra chinensis TaxID=642074 RepID=A0ABD0YEU8_9HEMI
MASKRRNMFHENNKQETREIGTRNLPSFCDYGWPRRLFGWARVAEFRRPSGVGPNALQNELGELGAPSPVDSTKRIFIPRTDFANTNRSHYTLPNIWTVMWQTKGLIIFFEGTSKDGLQVMGREDSVRGEEGSVQGETGSPSREGVGSPVSPPRRTNSPVMLATMTPVSVIDIQKEYEEQQAAAAAAAAAAGHQQKIIYVQESDLHRGPEEPIIIGENGAFGQEMAAEGNAVSVVVQQTPSGGQIIGQPNAYQGPPGTTVLVLSELVEDMTPILGLRCVSYAALYNNLVSEGAHLIGLTSWDVEVCHDLNTRLVQWAQSRWALQYSEASNLQYTARGITEIPSDGGHDAIRPTYVNVMGPRDENHLWTRQRVPNTNGGFLIAVPWRKKWLARVGPCNVCTTPEDLGSHRWTDGPPPPIREAFQPVKECTP